jgi:thioredoxin 1
MATNPESDEAFFKREVLLNPLPVLVEYSAVWCAPCKMLDPIIDQIAGEWADKIKVIKIDVDYKPDIAMQYQVMSVPTLMLFVNGEIRERLTGYQPKDRIVNKLKPHLPNI